MKELLQIVKMILWGLIGIRSSSGSRYDARAFRPAHAFGAALVILAIFLGILLTVVHLAVDGAK